MPGAVQDEITPANFCEDRLRGFGVARGRILAFSIDLLRRFKTLSHYRASVWYCTSVGVVTILLTIVFDMCLCGEPKQKTDTYSFLE